MSEVRSSETLPIRIMIVDDHPLVRDGLKVLLMTAPDMTLVAEAGNGKIGPDGHNVRVLKFAFGKL